MHGWRQGRGTGKGGGRASLRTVLLVGSSNDTHAADTGMHKPQVLRCVKVEGGAQGGSGTFTLFCTPSYFAPHFPPHTCRCPARPASTACWQSRTFTPVHTLPPHFPHTPADVQRGQHPLLAGRVVRAHLTPGEESDRAQARRHAHSGAQCKKGLLFMTRSVCCSSDDLMKYLKKQVANRQRLCWLNARRPPPLPAPAPCPLICIPCPAVSICYRTICIRCSYRLTELSGNSVEAAFYITTVVHLPFVLVLLESGVLPPQ